MPGMTLVSYPKAVSPNQRSTCEQHNSKPITPASSLDNADPVDVTLHLDRLSNQHRNRSQQLQVTNNLPFRRKMITLGAVVLPVLGMVAAILLAWPYGMMSWLNLAMLVGGWYLTGLGITIGFHRMLTHGSFKARPIVYYCWTALGSLAVQGSPIEWCLQSVPERS